MHLGPLDGGSLHGGRAGEQTACPVHLQLPRVLLLSLHPVVLERPQAEKLTCQPGCCFSVAWWCRSVPAFHVYSRIMEPGSLMKKRHVFSLQFGCSGGTGLGGASQGCGPCRWRMLPGWGWRENHVNQRDWEGPALLCFCFLIFLRCIYTFERWSYTERFHIFRFTPQMVITGVG